MTELDVWMLAVIGLECDAETLALVLESFGHSKVGLTLVSRTLDDLARGKECTPNLWLWV